MQLEKLYKPKLVEEKWRKIWEKYQIYKYSENSNKPVYSIDTPPPYVSATYLHAGHAMSYIQAEIIVRYKRMQGYNIFYPMGFDDNGLPTERHVEKKYKVDKTKIKREDFIKLCLKETDEVKKIYEKMLKSLGISVDWSLLYSTIGKLAQKIAQKSFIDLYNKGLIYQIEAPNFWCVDCQTALSQADLEDKERIGKMYYIKFSKIDNQSLIVATTRPELIPACVALYVNPDDKRYKKFIGNRVKTPIFNQEVEIKTSPDVEKEKGTGLMMVCTWGDAEDVKKWRKDKLDTKVIIDKNGIFNNLAGKYKGLKINQARKAIVKDLHNLGLIEKVEEVRQAVNVHERCGVPIEFLSSPQWFIKILDYKKEFLKRGRKLKWFPKFMKVRYEEWVNGLSWDWCISRDRYFGTPFPVWRCSKCGKVILADEKELPVDPREKSPKISQCPVCGNKEFIPETQVMDTWMTSSLTPLINAKWKEKKSLFKKIYPMSLRVQAFEIIRTWLFYTIVKSHFHTQSLPWDAVMISGWGLDKNGKKMSKSKGNFIAADKIVDKYSADGLRWWATNSSLGQSLRFSEEDVKAGVKLTNKLWNVTRFVLINIKNYKQSKAVKITEYTDKWIMAELQETVKKITNDFEHYDYNKARISLEKFFWLKYCDNYLELCKVRLNSDNKQAKLSAQFTLIKSLNILLKLFAPIIPYVTEEIYHILNNEKENHSIHLTSWPKVERQYLNKEIIKEGELLIKIMHQIRSYRLKKFNSHKQPIKQLAILTKTNHLENFIDEIQKIFKIDKIFFNKKIKGELFNLENYNTKIILD